MIDYTLAQIADIVGGELTDGADPAAKVTGFVEFDSRKVTAGGLFVALPGERVDGHDFAAGAIDRGAAAVLAAHPVGVPAIVVTPADNTPQAASEAVVTAMSDLAAAVAKQLTEEHGLTIVGITGSAGKTSTKDLAAAVVGKAGSTVAPPGSFNNEIGHPYTVLRCDEDTDFLIAEMSARGIGHIRHLAQIARPRIGVVLNVGTAHLGEFGSRENIAQAKGELIEALPSAAEGGVAILNADDPFVLGMAPRTTARVVTISSAQPPAPTADYQATGIMLDDVARASFTLHARGQDPVKVRLQVFGAHQVSNALAAAAVGVESGMSAAQVAEALNNHYAASAHRMDVNTRPDGVTVINDSYNANPESMRAGVAALAYTASSRPGVRSIAVLGEMGELGEDGRAEHVTLGEELARFNVGYLVTVGASPNCRAMTEEAARRGITTTVAENNDEATAAVEAILASPNTDQETYVGGTAGGGDVVLVKASNSARLWEVAEKLLGRGSR
ncbi:UDP-N-acetylmuramoyl-tripeptide--D-alanyl-D-alanine ligase [Corynebacterium guangdongense]|uniref:UDP-N-acetylmuramoyl-tripeptide--D-alanyl-D-alanine ligase n=1 Tax=Corynebacterium guangdongense TaxID=1783348 RepID=A0ABU1ZZQ5_9CORY|nr:UDP-N-acetylmuramoyl-tripeptide--D-alanyl-D-alanine ligase [Corynebacterium guangdongense]MDR7329742.1 UDP-N-acetylmuramoyl-tripeptide--D-alanyl-D-alanine ligase [Corynebacterium guangdongense]WJZ18306.1 UDP-N-acetylmuramoyl-tripeptide--D-alanyl-D-alanine ligase [Corynebacterium guangdongense]